MACHAAQEFPMKRIVSLSVIAVLLQGCSWVKLTPEGEKARVLTGAETRNCTKLGITTVSMATKVAIIPLNQKKVKAELENLARNSVADFKGGDSVAPLGDPQEGKQTFEIYDCVN
jgi:hypothetical protein